MTTKAYDPQQNLIGLITSRLPFLAKKKIAIGFDGFVDSIVRVVKSKDGGLREFIPEMGGFGAYIIAQKGHNFFVELDEVVTKSGGNMPNFANALAQFGCNISCVGALGYPSIHPAFKTLPANCTLYGYANPGITTALEFNDGKILMSQIGSLNLATWDTVNERVGQSILSNIFSGCDLIGVLNWGELDNATSLWRGLLENILANTTIPEKKPIVFFDLCDCSKRTHTAIAEVLDVIAAHAKYFKVVLSLNGHEARVVGSVLGGSAANGSLEDIGASIYKGRAADMVLVHQASEAMLWHEGQLFKRKSFFTTQPKISTGAGDNFNAGFCAGLLMELDPHACLLLAHATSACYLQSGVSPLPETLARFIKSNLANLSQ